MAVRGRRRVLVGLAVAALPFGLPTPAGAAVEIGPERITVGADGASAVIERSPVRLSFRDSSGRTVLSQVPNTGAGPLPAATIDPEPGGGDSVPDNTLYQPFAFEVGGGANPEFPGGPWTGNQLTGGRAGIQYSAREVVAAARDGAGVRLELSTSDPTGRRVILTVRPDADAAGALAVSARLSSEAGVSAMSDSFASGTDEAFRGFGGRHAGVDQRGKTFTSWVEQQNFSAGPLEGPVSALPGTGGRGYQFPNGPLASYYPQALFVSSRPYGFMLDRNELARFRMASARPDAWQVDVAASAIDYVVAPGAPAAAIRSLTAINGRHRLPPAWSMGPTLSRTVKTLSADSETPASYEAKVRDDVARLERDKLGVETYAFEGWDVLPRPFVRQTIARLRARGIRSLLYLRAFVASDVAGTERPELFTEAVQRGYLAKTAAGTPFLYGSNFVVGVAGLIDFTNPAAVAWWRGRVREMLDLGADGFMQDFGEQTQTGMRFAGGETGATMHNRYPALFHRTTRAITDEYERQSGREIFFFTRAGYSGRPGAAAFEQSNFPGDETTDYTPAAGLASIVPDMLNRGIGGAFGYNTDIGGYADFVTPRTTPELFVRWSEAAALMPFFRVHNSASNGVVMPWTYGAEVQARWRRLAELHVRARPLIRRLWAQAARGGLPPARPMWLAFPGDAALRNQSQQWMLGDDVLVAPVVDQGQSARDVRFPAGCWSAPESGQVVRGPRTARVPAPLGTLPYFFRCGTNPFAEAAGRRSCLARRSPIGPRNIGRIALGRKRATLRRRIATLKRTRRTDRWCVKASGGRVVAVYGRRGRSALVTSTAGRHRMRGVGNGASVRALRRAFPRRRGVGRRIVRAGPRSRRIFGVRRGRVRWVAVADRSLLRSGPALRRSLRRAGIRP